MQKRINFIEDLSRSDLDHLAQLLYFPTTTNDPSPNDPLFPPENWLASQSDTLSSFPAHLLRSTSFLPKLAMKMPFTAPKAVLCSVHKPLNPFLVRRIFMQMSAETGLRVQNLIATLEREDLGRGQGKGKDVDRESRESRGKEIDPEVRSWLRRLTRLNSLWMDPAHYRIKFRAMPDDKRFERIESGCMACILAFLGGKVQVVLDLRTGLLGRRKRGYESRLWGLVEAWTRCFGQAQRIIEESERVGKLVLRERRRARRKRRRERRERRLARKNGGSRAQTETEATAVGGTDGADDIDDGAEGAIGDFAAGHGQGSREAQDRDFEGSIIDFYRDAAGVDEDALHPAFRNSVAYDSASGTFHRRPQQPPPQQPSRSNRPADRAAAASRFTFYTQSAYSQDVGFGGGSSAPSMAQETVPPLPPLPSKTINPFVKASSSRNAQARHIAEKRAESYQNLVGIPEESSAHRAAPSEEETVEYMQKLWEPSTGTEAEEEDEAEAEARNARVQKALTDAYGDRSGADEEKKETHMTTWSGMMKKGGAKSSQDRDEGRGQDKKMTASLIYARN
jgi:hypothetical protein